MAFKHWSATNPDAKQTLKPTLGIKSWDEVDLKIKERIWQHFVNKGWFGADKLTYRAVDNFAEDHKANAYCNHLLGHGGPHYYELMGHGQSYAKDCCHSPAQMDFNNIFIRQPQDVVYELFSYYANTVANDPFNDSLYPSFVRMFNDISDQFNLNILISEDKFIFRQDKKITEDIYSPTLKILADKKWEIVGRELDDAFSDYLKNTPDGYSACITHSISALQAFLQILIHGKAGKGDITELIKEAENKNLIPADEFSKKIFKDSVSILMRERQEKGDPHPKEEYANEKTARLVLNLVMVFLQHCLQK